MSPDRPAPPAWYAPTDAGTASRGAVARALPLAGTGLGSVLADLAARAEPVLYHAVPGNAGDCAINTTAHQLLGRCGIPFEQVGDDVAAERTRGRVLVCAGAGNLVPLYDDVRRFLERHHAGCRRLVLLPATIRGHADLLAAFGPNVTLLCRDRPSLEHAGTVARRAQVLASHDVVLHLDVDALRRDARARFLPVVSSFAQARRNLRRRWRGLRYDLHNRGHRGELFAFRTDREIAAGRAVAGANFDASDEYVADEMSPALALEATWRLLDFLDRYRVVHTDRLHVAILAALLGKAVRLHDNSYGKNRVVYEQSLHAFPGVTPTWAEAPP
jgi:exopolysaccharide biosynthesis predicted pyruvyltransferase EpsI